MQESLRVAVLVNGRLCATGGSARALRRLRQRLHVVRELDTRGGVGDDRSAASLLVSARPEVLVAAGGDGTASLALRALLTAKCTDRTALAFLPLGTGNNAARSFGLRALRGGEHALELALGAIVAGPRRAADAGCVDGRPFLVSFAVGLDAEVLALRNRVQRRIGRLRAGWSVYFASALASVLRGGPPVSARIALDGAPETRPLRNLVVANVPLHAGPVRFDGPSDCADGRLDVHCVGSGFEYTVESLAAMLRDLRVRCGGSPPPSARLRRAREVVVELARPLPAEVDGEALGPAAVYRLHVLPGAVRVCVPA